VEQLGALHIITRLSKVVVSNRARIWWRIREVKTSFNIKSARRTELGGERVLQK